MPRRVSEYSNGSERRSLISSYDALPRYRATSALGAIPMKTALAPSDRALSRTVAR
jgi:HEAT repeat protein